MVLYVQWVLITQVLIRLQQVVLQVVLYGVVLRLILRGLMNLVVLLSLLIMMTKQILLMVQVFPYIFQVMHLVVIK